MSPVGNEEEIGMAYEGTWDHLYKKKSQEEELRLKTLKVNEFKRGEKLTQKKKKLEEEEVNEEETNQWYKTVS